MKKNAEIICVGTEIILGDIQNTHTQFLSQELAALGVNVFYHSSVGDNDNRFKQILKTALERSDIVFLTGGLGPTTDDITKEITCELMGIECEMSEEVKARIMTFFVNTNKKPTMNNFKQAMVPQNSIVLDNDWGTAPGFIIEKDGKTAVLLPGPPRELKPMFEYRVKPYLQKINDETIISKNVRVFGIGESALDEKISHLVLSQNPTVALYAKTGEVLVRVTSKEKTKEKAESSIDDMIGKIKAELGDMVYGIDKDSLHQTVVEMLVDNNKTIAVAESCTGGMLAQKITGIAGASQIFGLGIISYANEAKINELGVKKETLEQFGAVSEEVATQMAVGLSKKSGADFNIAITGIAGPSGGTEDKPVGTVYIALEHNKKVWCERYNFNRGTLERDYIRNSTCLSALNMVRLSIDFSQNVSKKFMDI